MSARDELLDLVGGLSQSVCWDRCVTFNCSCAEDDAGEAVQLLDKILREHAHELAEKIREAHPLRYTTHGRLTDVHMVADEIDPEVQ